MSDAPPTAWPDLRPLPAAFYLPSARLVAPRLLGCYLLRATDQGVMRGLIVETEAYLHDDPACHAFVGPTDRNRSMFGSAGRAYVYFIYGMHYCFNAVCGEEGCGEAVLIRAVEALDGVAQMRERRAARKLTDLTSGPSKLCQAMAIDRSLDGVDLCRSNSAIWIARNPDRRAAFRRLGPVRQTPRVGITRAAEQPLRFLLSRSAWVSRAS